MTWDLWVLVFGCIFIAAFMVLALIAAEADDRRFHCPCEWCRRRRK